MKTAGKSVHAAVVQHLLIRIFLITSTTIPTALRDFLIRLYNTLWLTEKELERVQQRLVDLENSLRGRVRRDAEPFAPVVPRVRRDAEPFAPVVPVISILVTALTTAGSVAVAANSPSADLPA